MAHPVTGPLAAGLHGHGSAAPGRLTLPAAAAVRRVIRENYRTVTLELDLALEAEPGQFVMAWLPRFDEKPFSLVNNDPVTLMVTAVGPFSRLVHQLRTGDRLWIRGPYGRGFGGPGDQRRVVLVGGGYGVAPLYWLARTIQPAVQQITAVVGARTAADLLYLDRFAGLAEDPGAVVETIATTEDGSRGQQGLVTGPLAQAAADGRVDGIYACGPHGMLAALQSLAQSHAIPCRLSWEAYMRCAVGICGACEHHGAVLCLDGPVLDA